MDKGRLLNLARKFKRIYESGEAYMPGHSWTLAQHQKDHERKVERAQRLLSLEHIPRLTEAELRELFADTDALGFFRDKDKRDKELDKLLSGEGTERIRSVLLSLFQEAEAELTPEAFLKAQQPTGVGPLLISELLSYRFPSRYYTYSPKATLDALKILGKDVRAAQPHGKKGDHYLYIVIRPLMGEICNALRKVGLTEVDYMLADIFFQWVYEVKPPDDELPPPEDGLTQYFASQGLHFTSEQLATFYTALKTKGFVILTGISGTGKTKLAQYFAELFFAPERTVTEEPEEAETVIRLQIQPYMLKYTRLIVPKGYWKLLDVPAAGETVEVELTFDSKSETCRLTHASYGAADYLQILFRGKARKWLTANFHEDDIILLEPAFSDEGDFIGFYLRKPETRQIRKREPNFYFASVRPDWKDSKSLLGYYNPLSEQFESTNFLRFILKAHQDLAVPYFVLLDEMNLAKVEYYFADFLSVLESGRDDGGFTKEAIRFQYPEGIDGPPRAFHLPPNLYFIGTVNVDETTYMFSPKVLDRAFTLELGTVNLEDYPGEQGEPLSEEVLEQLRAHLLPDFTRQGRFAVVDKTRVSKFAATHDIYRQHLSTLNVLLRSHDLHFGYRVFDEIMMFLANAEGSPVFDGFGPGGLDAAFDAAVLMKVLPKFHGTRGKLRLPLLNVFAWAITPDAGHELRKQVEDLEKEIAGSEEKEGARLDLIEELRGSPGEGRIGGKTFAYPRTALKALRMLHDLHTTGFASFA